MATITRQKNGRWRARVSACGRRASRTFERKDNAKAWVALTETHFRGIARIADAVRIIDEDLTVPTPPGYWERQRIQRDVDESRQYKLYRNLVTAVKESGCPPIELEIALLSTILTFIKSERMDKLAETLDYVNRWAPSMPLRGLITVSSGKHLETAEMAKDPIDGNP